MNPVLLSLCAALLVFSAIGAFIRSFRYSILSVWFSGILCGVIFLYLGSEVLAITQWTLSTIIALCFLVYSILFGNFLEPETHSVIELKTGVLPLLASAVFFLIIGIGLQDLDFKPQEVAVNTVSIKEFGSNLLQNQQITLIIMGVHLLLVMVGFGVVSRADWTTNRTLGGQRDL